MNLRGAVATREGKKTPETDVPGAQGVCADAPPSGTWDPASASEHAAAPGAGA